MITRKLIDTDQRFSIGKIVCLARNYAEHARELGNETPDAPVLFMKPASSVIGDADSVKIPNYSDECHFEVELALLVGKQCREVSVEEAGDYIAGYGVAIDMTLRDVQGRLKAKGLPWEIAKGFDTACPLSDFVLASSIAEPQNLNLMLSVNGDVRQNGTASDMIHGIPQIIAYISAIFTLEAGDIILTGTPAGVGKVVSGDVMTAEIPLVGKLKITVT
ncbi:MAG: fumarylacetoacetate hydrolase family protein [Desulfuromonadaceae bacterium]|nr:fumarylacetoacetate hydrolase family protein [Desulfuromonadaceae bacterium]MDD2854278.1 fumarylacetoacetate hydrolase family protein [Desulfuromonadaceae bacterium]